MCGISGILNLKEPQKIKIAQLKEMISVLDHRGPDEVGAFRDNWAGLVHSRLSIIGIQGGVQPIHNEDKSLWIIFNGEIYSAFNKESFSYRITTSGITSDNY